MLSNLVALCYSFQVLICFLSIVLVNVFYSKFDPDMNIELQHYLIIFNMFKLVVRL